MTADIERQRARDRLLLIEDDPGREAQIRIWLPEYHIVTATTAGAAVGIVKRDQASDYAAVIIDCDLYRRPHAPGARLHDGRDVARLIAQRWKPDLPVLVHSNNPTGGPVIADLLRGAGFDVTSIRMADLTMSRLRSE